MPATSTVRDYEIIIPDWLEGCSLTVPAAAESAAGALAAVVAWVNRRAGYRYCDRLPPGTRVVCGGRLVHLLR